MIRSRRNPSGIFIKLMNPSKPLDRIGRIVIILKTQMSEMIITQNINRLRGKSDTPQFANHIYLIFPPLILIKKKKIQIMV